MKIFFSLLIMFMLNLFSQSAYCDALPEYAKFSNIDATGAKVTIDYSHHEIHEGNNYILTEVNTIASAGTRAYLITTPNTDTYTHLIFSITSSLKVSMTLTEAPTGLSAGTSLTPINLNRNSTKTASTIIKHTPSGSASGGTLLYTRTVGDGTTPSQVSSTTQRIQNEIILKKNTVYYFLITSAANSNIVNTEFNFYETTFPYYGKL